jgi:DNA mismatch repair protein MutS2
MSGGGGISPSVLETLEFAAALELIAAHTAGPLGAARVRSRRPDTDPVAIRDALAQVAELASLVLVDESIRAAAVPDVSDPLALLGVAGAVLDGSALVALGRAVASARAVDALLAGLAPDAPRTAALRAPLPPRSLDQRLRASLGPDGEVLDDASKELSRARRAVRETRARLVARLESIVAALDPADRPADTAVTVRNGRYVIPVRATARARVGGIVHDASATRATLFVEPPEVIELGNELRAREADEQREVLRVLRGLTDLARPHRATIAGAVEMCVAFDDLCARAHYAAAVNGFAPAVGEGPLVIRQGRHPLLAGPAGVVVPFDLALAADEWTVLVSGPNTGGKTVLVKAVGLLSLLAQAGVVPPIGPESRLPLFTQVFADIGDRQSIAASLSTFSAHAAALVEILERAGPGTLVLLDEIGSGTDPAEGGALAAAVLRALTRRRAVTLATTHLGVLKRLASETTGIVNASLQFDAETLTPTYRFVKGVPGRSYGLAIARRLGVPPAVLAEAGDAVPDTERALDALLAEVEARSRELAALEHTLAEERARLERERAVVTERGDALALRERDVRERERGLDAAARARARDYLLGARRKVEDALAVARAAVDEATAREARRLVEEAIAAQREPSGPERSGAATPLAVGDRARVGTGGAVGVVREVRGDGSVVLDVGGMRVTVPVAEARPAGAEAAAAPVRRGARPGAATPADAAASAIDLRGLRVDEVDDVLLRALDAAVLAELPYLRIIHGKGTGALRARVEALLADDPRVAHAGAAPPREGGAGVTVAVLRP